jgi:hypothetical protein
MMYFGVILESIPRYCLSGAILLVVAFDTYSTWHLAQSHNVGDWSSGMIPSLGDGGPAFDSPVAPF